MLILALWISIFIAPFSMKEMVWFNFRSILHLLSIWTKSYLIKADNSVVIGEAWRVDIPNMADPTGTFDEITVIPCIHDGSNPGTGFNLIFNSVKTNKSAVCIKGAKHVSKSLYNNPRWTLMPNFDLCQYYPTGKPRTHAPKSISFEPGGKVLGPIWTGIHPILAGSKKMYLFSDTMR